MPKILFVNCSDSGSTGKIVRDTAAILHQKGWQTVLLVPRFRRENTEYDRCYTVSNRYEQAVFYRVGCFLGKQYDFAPFSTGKILKIIEKERPDLVHLHCLNGYFVDFFELMNFLKKKKIPTVVTNHAEFYYTGNCSYAVECQKWQTGCGNCPHLGAYTDPLWRDRTAESFRKMRQAFADFPLLTVTSVSPWVAERCAKSPTMKNVRQVTVENGVDTELFRITDTAALRNRLGIPSDVKILFHATAHFSAGKSRKGGNYILDLAHRLEGQNILLMVAGPFADDFEQPKNMRFLGLVTPEELAEYYSLADLCVVTSRLETFGMTVAESLCCGTPVVGFANGGTCSIALPEYTAFCPYGDSDALAKLTEEWLSKKTPQVARETEAAAHQKYSRERMATAYLAVYENLLAGRSDKK